MVKYHDELEQKKFDDSRARWLNEHGYRMVRFTNEEVINNISFVLEKIRKALSESTSPSPLERGSGGEVFLNVFTTRPDTIFGVDFMVVAPEHELVKEITSAEPTGSH